MDHRCSDSALFCHLVDIRSKTFLVVMIMGHEFWHHEGKTLLYHLVGVRNISVDELWRFEVGYPWNRFYPLDLGSVQAPAKNRQFPLVQSSLIQSQSPGNDLKFVHLQQPATKSWWVQIPLRISTKLHKHSPPEHARLLSETCAICKSKWCDEVLLSSNLMEICWFTQTDVV